MRIKMHIKMRIKMHIDIPSVYVLHAYSETNRIICASTRSHTFTCMNNTVSFEVALLFKRMSTYHMKSNALYSNTHAYTTCIHTLSRASASAPASIPGGSTRASPREHHVLFNQPQTPRRRERRILGRAFVAVDEASPKLYGPGCGGLVYVVPRAEKPSCGVMGGRSRRESRRLKICLLGVR